MQRRLSRGTPYVLTSTDLENILSAVTPKMVQHITALLDMEPAEWDKLDDRMRARHIVDFQQRGLIAASMAAAAKAQTDLEATASPITEKIQEQTQLDLINERLDALTEQIQRSTARPQDHRQKARR